MTARSHRRRRLAAVALAVAVIGLGGCGGDDGADAYSDDTRAAMLGGCREKDTDPDLAEVCECAYDGMVKTLPFDEFAALDRRLADGDSRLPAEVVQIIRACIRSVSSARS